MLIKLNLCLFQCAQNLSTFRHTVNSFILLPLLRMLFILVLCMLSPCFIVSYKLVTVISHATHSSISLHVFTLLLSIVSILPQSTSLAQSLFYYFILFSPVLYLLQLSATVYSRHSMMACLFMYIINFLP